MKYKLHVRWPKLADATPRIIVNEREVGLVEAMERMYENIAELETLYMRTTPAWVYRQAQKLVVAKPARLKISIDDPLMELVDLS